MDGTGRADGLFCTLTLEAEPYRLGLLRHAVSVWLTAVRWPADASSQIVSAVGEAVSNTIEHAYTSDPPGPVRVALRVEGAGTGHERVRVVVSDRGRWRPGDPAPPRGNGMLLMQALCAAVDVETDAPIDGAMPRLSSSPRRPAPVVTAGRALDAHVRT